MKVIVKTANGNIECASDSELLLASKCRSCGAEIYWVKTKAGKSMPIERTASGDMISHFATCPNASKHRNVN